VFGPRSARPPRRGNVALVFLVLLPALVLVVVLVLHTTQLEQARGEIQQAADAAALAAALALVDDASLRGDARALLSVFQRAQDEAVRYAGGNRVLGTASRLLLTADNDPEGDVVFGIADGPNQPLFPVDLNDPELLPLVNAVRVRVVRSRERGQHLPLIGGAMLNGRTSDMTRSATALLDRGVIGFRQVVAKPIPLVPIALLSDPSSDDSWEGQVEGKGKERQDKFRYEAEPYRALSDRGDGLAEMTVHLLGQRGKGGKGGKDGPSTNGLLLHLGSGHPTELARQVRDGVVEDDLRALGGELVLGPGNRLPIPGSPDGPGENTLGFAELLLALKDLQNSGEVRAWPLFDPLTDESGTPVVSGFVAARVMAVSPGQSGLGLKVILQPASLQSSCVVTAPFGQNDDRDRPLNRYLSKVRLAN